MFIFFLFFSGVSIVLAFFLLLVLWNPFRQTYTKQAGTYEPVVSVIIPVKGVDVQFSAFLESLKAQTYSKAEYLFCLTDANDPAIPIIKEVLVNFPARIVVAEPDRVNCDKVQNMMSGLAQIRPQDEVAAFIDADGVLTPDYIAVLVEPLQDSRYVCASTYRKYQADSFGGMIVKYWNEIGTLFKEFSVTRFIFAGGMALRCRDLKSLDIPLIWEKVLSDDMTLNKVIASRGWKVYAVKRYAVSSTNAAFLKAVSWISRQQAMMFFYHKTMHLLLIAEMFFVVFLAGLSFLTHQIIFLLPMTSFFVMFAVLIRRYGTRREWLFFPFIFSGLIFAYTASWIVPFFMRKIRWGDFEYSLDRKGKIILQSRTK